METISDCNCEKKNVLSLLTTRKFFVLDFIPTCCLLCKVQTMDFSDSEEEDEEGSIDEDEEEGIMKEDLVVTN